MILSKFICLQYFPDNKKRLYEVVVKIILQKYNKKKQLLPRGNIENLELN